MVPCRAKLTDQEHETGILLREPKGHSSDEDELVEPRDDVDVSVGNKVASTAGLAFIILCCALSVLGIVYKDEVYDLLTTFSALLGDWGSWGYVAFALVYVALEILAVPAIPLTMSAGVLFGPWLGLAVVSLASTAAAAASFLIARYVARDKVVELAKGNAKFSAIDKAIGQESFKIVLLLRLSPLLPFALSNYFYGLTSVDLTSYVLGSWLGMMPGTFAFVSAGDVGRVVFEQTSATGDLAATLSSSNVWPLALGVGGTIAATGFISRIVTKTLKELEIE